MTNTTGFIDASAHPTAIPFYNLFPNEPIPPEKVAGTVNVAKLVKLKDANLLTLLDAIGDKVKKGGNVLIVMHGTKEGLNATISSQGKGKTKKVVHLELAALDAIRRNTEETEDDATTAKTLMLDAAGWKKLKAQIERVQKLELDRVDLRACNIGQNEFAMSALQQFFNCNTLCAPVLYDSFGPIPAAKVTQDAATWQKWQQDHPDATIEGTSPNRFGLDYKINQKVMLDALAESEQAIKDWVKTHLPAGTYSKGPLFYHAITDLKVLTFSGDPGFRDKLAEAYRGKVPSRKIDLNAPLPIP